MACIGIALRWLFPAVVGALLLTTAAQADCLGIWDLSGSWAITQTNGFIANFELTQTGMDISGTATAQEMTGDVVGHVDGDEFTMTAHWNGTAGGEYRGHITERGIEGDTRDLNNPGAEGARWYGDHGVTPCTVSTPPSHAPASPLEQSGVLKNRPGAGDISTQTKPPPPPAGGGGGEFPTTPPQVTMATVIADVDVYKKPGGLDEDKIGILYSNNKTTKVSLVAPCDENNYCHVKGTAVPTGEGFVYSGTPPDFQSLQF